MAAALAIPVLIAIVSAVVMFLLGGISIISLVTFMFVHPFISILIVAGIFGIVFMVKK